jgi:hypothetical protein
MSLADIAHEAKGMTDYRIDQKLDELFRTHPTLKNLKGNQDLIFDIIKKYKEKSRQGIKTSDYTVRHDMHNLYENRLELGLSVNDLDQLRELLETFKS